MKQQWDKLALKIDSLSLRERAMVFAGVVAAVIYLTYSGLIEPLYKRQAALTSSINDQQSQMLGIDADIAKKLLAYAIDPDTANRASLAKAKREVAELNASLLSLQTGLVAPEKMIPLLQQLLRGHDKLRLQSMKTLPVTGISQGAYLPKRKGEDKEAPPAPGSPQSTSAMVLAAAQLSGVVALPPPAGNVAAAPAPVKPDELMYRHGVEIVVQGAYADLVDYMTELEGLPTHLYWGQARLDTGVYPEATLTLTLYTLSLDQKWMTL